MIEIKKIINILNKNKIDFFTGIPDSVLKSLSNYLSKYTTKKHIIAANEGSAISLATGYYLSTKKIPVVYLQNSGLGNIVNPIVSIAHKKIYSIPMLLFIGWRGVPGMKDEVQHQVQGKITLKLLKLLGIKYRIINHKIFNKQLTGLIKYAKKHNQPVACLIKKNDLSSYEKNNLKNGGIKNASILRSEFLQRLMYKTKQYKIVATTGFTSREMYQLRKNKNLNKEKDFYMVGGMGHTSMVAFGYSLFSKKNIICLDGDGSFLMHLGSAATIGQFSKNNFKYILLNNGCHESVGGQPTIVDKIDIRKLSHSLGYKNYFFLNKKKTIGLILKSFLNSNGPAFLEVIIKTGSPKNLLRIKNLSAIKKNFIKK